VEPTSGRQIAGDRLAGEARQSELGQARSGGGGAQLGENVLPMLLAVAPGIHGDIDILAAEARPPMRRCVRAGETELVHHG
jgi:hypothetical protein